MAIDRHLLANYYYFVELKVLDSVMQTHASMDIEEQEDDFVDQRMANLNWLLLRLFPVNKVNLKRKAKLEYFDSI